MPQTDADNLADEYADLHNNNSVYADGRRNADDDTRDATWPMGTPAGYYSVPQPTSGAASNPNSGGAGTFYPSEHAAAQAMAEGMDAASRLGLTPGPGGTSASIEQYDADEGVDDEFVPDTARR